VSSDKAKNFYLFIFFVTSRLKSFLMLRSSDAVGVCDRGKKVFCFYFIESNEVVHDYDDLYL
jgi:hypothetical protein